MHVGLNLIFLVPGETWAGSAAFNGAAGSLTGNGGRARAALPGGDWTRRRRPSGVTPTLANPAYAPFRAPHLH